DFQERIAVVSFVRDHRLGFVISQQFLCLVDVCRLAGCQLQLDGVAQGIETPVDLGGKSATAAAESLLVLATAAIPLFLAPAAAGWARTVVESRINHSRSSSRNSAITLAQTPRTAQRSKRRQTLFQLPKRSGKSRHGIPVRATYKTASTNKRLSAATPPCYPARPRSTT